MNYFGRKMGATYYGKKKVRGRCRAGPGGGTTMAKTVSAYVCRENIRGNGENV